MIAVDAVLVGLVVVAQSLNLLARPIRFAVTAAALLGIVLATWRSPRTWEPMLFCVVVGLLVLGKKFNAEIEEDMDARDVAQRQPLLRGPKWLLYLDPTYGLRYRRRLFRDEWSRRRLLIRSVQLPGRLASRGTARLLDGPPGRHRSQQDEVG